MKQILKDIDYNGLYGGGPGQRGIRDQICVRKEKVNGLVLVEWK